ncbi:hypothetical protein, partial [Brachyspira intermedia]
MYKNRNIYLCSFYSLDLYPSYTRFMQQAKKIDIFDDIFVYNQFNLPTDKKFEDNFYHKLKAKYRYGYWVWKPFIILNEMIKINEEDIIIYMDIGCNINDSGIKRLYEYLDIVIEYDNLCFELEFLEKCWTKGDLFNYFNKINDKSVTDSKQRCATGLILKKTEKNVSFLKEWLDVFYNDFSLIDDTKSHIHNLDGFIENRHDQSAFSILSKIHNFHSISAKEFETNDHNFPFNASRDKKFIGEKFTKDIGWLVPIKNMRDEIRNYLKYNINNFLSIHLGYKKAKSISDKIVYNFFNLILKNEVNKYL